MSVLDRIALHWRYGALYIRGYWRFLYWWRVIESMLAWIGLAALIVVAGFLFHAGWAAFR